MKDDEVRVWNGEVVIPSPLYKVPRLVAVAPDEVTCLVCGQTFQKRLAWCPTCSSEEGCRVKTPTVPTVSYLREDEYYISR